MADVKLNSISTEKDGKRTNVEIREISNGFIIRTSTEYKDKKGQWQYETKEEYSKENPFDPSMMKLKIIKEALGKC